MDSSHALVPSRGLQWLVKGGLVTWIVALLLGGMVGEQVASGQQVVTRGPAGAGMMTGGFGRGMWEPSISTKDLERYAAVLELGQDQREAAGMLLEAMQQEFGETAAAARTRLDTLRGQLRETQDTSIATEKIPEVMRSVQERREALETEFMADLRLLLEDHQEKRWPNFERMRRRDTSLTHGALAGESVDLIRLFSELGLASQATESTKPILEQYELDMDRALQARNEVLRRLQGMLGGGIRALELAAQSDEFQKHRAEAHEMRVRVRDINRRYARQIGASIPTDAALQFEAGFREASFPQVYRDTFAERALDAATGFDDLTVEQREAIAAMQERLDQELASANDRLASAIDKAQSNGNSPIAAGGGLRLNLNPSEGEGEVGEARGARRELEQKYLENLRNLLTDAQRDRLPKPRERGRGRSVSLPGGGEMVIDGDDGGGAAAVFVSDDGGEQNVFVFRRTGDGEPAPEGARIRITREVSENGERVVEEIEVVSDDAGERPPPE